MLIFLGIFHLLDSIRKADINPLIQIVGSGAVYYQIQCLLWMIVMNCILTYYL